VTRAGRGRAVAGVAGLGLAVAYLAWTVVDLPLGRLAEPGAGVFPLVVGALLVVASAALVAEARRDEPRARDTRPLPRGPERRRWFAATAALLGYPVLLPLLGYLPATFLVSAALLRRLTPARQSWKTTLLRAAVLVGLAWALFAAALGVPLPPAPFGWRP
jgi:hypothetical protein